MTLKIKPTFLDATDGVQVSTPTGPISIKGNLWVLSHSLKGDNGSATFKVVCLFKKTDQRPDSEEYTDLIE